jgi:toxin ParE1/3/4
MAARLTWAAGAVRDLRHIAEYIASDSDEAARRTVRQLVGKAERAAQFPRAGRVVPEVGRDEIRQLVWRSYRVIYRLNAEGITVLAVVHGARRLEDLLGDLC